MKREFLEQCPIAIVSAGCYLPEARNLKEFWQRLIEGNPLIRPVSEERWSSEDHLCSNRSDREKTYTRWAAHVPEEEYARLKQKWMPEEKGLFRMDLQFRECMSQILEKFPNGFGDKKVDFFYGAMFHDDAPHLATFERETDDIRACLKAMDDPRAEEWLQEFEKFREKKITPYTNANTMLISSFVRIMQDAFNFKGAGSLVDAACASSVVAVEVAMRRLITGEADYAITGGVETFLAPTAFVAFTSMGALAPEVGLPLDRRSQGLSLGEGCVLFMLQRLEDAIRDGNEVLALIEGIGGSSDGNAASLFSPTVNGQRRAYRECYQDTDLKRLVYLENHGTGTVLGDAVEMQSSAEFFGDLKIPIGSAKALWGHTRGAAGALGMLKALMILQKKEIPPSKYFKNKIESQPSNLYVNTEVESWKRKNPGLVGVSSFGFGGINYHVALGEYLPPEAGASEEVKPPLKSVLRPLDYTALILGYERVTMEEIAAIPDWSAFKIPSRSRAQVDATQLAALLTTKRALDKARLPLKLIEKDRVVVISTCSLGLDNIKRFANCVQYQGIASIFPSMPPERLADLQKLRERYPPVNEDSGAGGLNNVIAGRVANFFDFHGKNYHIDCDGTSWPFGIECAVHELQHDADLVILLGYDYNEAGGAKTTRVDFYSGTSTLLVSDRVARRMGLNVESRIRVVEACRIS